MSVQSLESPRQNKHRGYDNGKYPDALPDRSPIFLLFAVGDQNQGSNRPERRDRDLHQSKYCIEHVDHLPRREHRIDLMPMRLFSRIACSTILLASIVMLGVVALSTVSAMREYERILAAEARI